MLLLDSLLLRDYKHRNSKKDLADYDDFLQYDEEMIRKIRPLAEEFVGAIETIL
jgi:hypothetical protein